MSDAKALFRRYLTVWQEGSLADLDDILHESYVGHPVGGDRDSNGLKERILAFRALFPDVHFSIERQVVEGERVATSMTAVATRASDGKPVRLFGQNISRIQEGRLAEEWMVWEVAALN